MRSLLLLAAAAAICAGDAVIVTVGPKAGDVVGADSLALQKAADLLAQRAPTGGGILRIASGTYAMRNSLHITVPMTVRGEGMGRTVLRKSPQVLTTMTAATALDATTVTLADAAWVRPGDGVALRFTKDAANWWNVLRTVTKVDGTVITIDLPIGAEPKPKPGDPAFGAPDKPFPAGAPVQHAFPLISAVSQRWTPGGGWIRDVIIEDLTVDGNKAENPDVYMDGCRNGGIYLFRGERCAIRRVHAKDFAGDGLSWQMINDMVVEDCIATGNGTAFAGDKANGYGFHPGTGSLRTIITRGEAHGNGDIGLYVCWNIKSASFSRLVLTGNGNHGISIGHNDTDNAFDTIVSSRNGHTGLWFRNESPRPDRNRFVRMRIEDNGSTARPGMGVVLYEVKGIELIDSVIRDTRPESARTQRTALTARGRRPSQLSAFTGNTIEGAIDTEKVLGASPVP